MWGTSVRELETGDVFIIFFSKITGDEIPEATLKAGSLVVYLTMQD